MKKPSYASIRDFLNLTLQQDVFRGRRFRVIILMVSFGFILAWQLNFALNANELEGHYRLAAATGSRHKYVSQFAYFYYYLRLFPVVTTYRPLQFSEEDARDIIDNHGGTLYMDTPGYWAIRFGDFGKAFMYLPDAVIKRAPWNLSVHPLTGTVFILALVGVYLAFWWAEMPLLGILIVFLIGSNPFQLFEVYQNENVFGWPITTATLILAFNVPLISNKKPPTYWLWTAPILSGCFLGAVKHIRTEPALMIISVAFVCLTVAKTQWRVRLGLLLLLAISFVTVERALHRYFQHKIEEAAVVVEEAGGYPLAPQQYTTHGVWFSIWCGLGDFDEKYGYKWADGTGYRYAAPILREKFNITVKGQFLDQANKYCKKMENLPEFRELIRDKVIHDIVADPLWYGGILWKRIKRVFSVITPARLALGKWSADIPMQTVLLVPTLILLLFFRAWMPLKLICFTFPLSLVAICVYSGQGTTYYTCFHLILAAIYLGLLVEGVLWLVRWLFGRKRQRNLI